jgi:DNA invertase Pin-like site-specific DNA recombinase
VPPPLRRRTKMIKKKAEVTMTRTCVNVAIYARVSSDKQARREDGSLDTQLDFARRAVAIRTSPTLPWEVVKTLVEGEKDGRRHGKSAKNTDRPAYQELLELARSRLIDVVIVTKLDRISRNVRDFLELVDELTKYDVKLIRKLSTIVRHSHYAITEAPLPPERLRWVA